MKLIRDSIKFVDFPEGASRCRAVTDPWEHAMLLDRKLLEEAAEFLTAGNATDQAAEAADLIEVIRARCALNGTPFEVILEIMAVKRAERGGFSKGTVWDV